MSERPDRIRPHAVSQVRSSSVSGSDQLIWVRWRHHFFVNRIVADSLSKARDVTVNFGTIVGNRRIWKKFEYIVRIFEYPVRNFPFAGRRRQYNPQITGRRWCDFLFELNLRAKNSFVICWVLIRLQKVLYYYIATKNRPQNCEMPFNPVIGWI